MGDGFLYYWIFDNGLSMWIFGTSPDNSEHGIEILEDNHELCVDERNNNRSQVWTKSVWREDLTLQVKCIDPDHNIQRKKDDVEDIIKIFDDKKTVPGSCCVEIKVSSVDIGQV